MYGSVQCFYRVLKLQS